MRAIFKYLYAGYCVLFFLFLISVIIIISEQGFHLIDLAWLLLFTSIVFVLWFLKMRLTGNNSLSPLNGINKIVSVGLTIFGAVSAFLMLFYSFG